MATNVNLGGTYDITTVVREFVPTQLIDFGFRRGSIKNIGSATIFIGLNKVPDLATTAEESDKVVLSTGEALRIPRRCTRFFILTSAGSSKIIYIED